MKQPDIVLSCDHPGCMAIPMLAPRIYVPAKGTTAREFHKYPQVTLAFPRLHYCHAHWNETMRLSLLLDDRVKARIEERGRKIWPQGVRPDFDAALIEPIEVHSPEYGAYMKRLGFQIDGLGYSLFDTMRRRRGQGSMFL